MSCVRSSSGFNGEKVQGLRMEKMDYQQNSDNSPDEESDVLKSQEFNEFVHSVFLYEKEKIENECLTEVNKIIKKNDTQYAASIEAKKHNCFLLDQEILSVEAEMCKNEIEHLVELNDVINNHKKIISENDKTKIIENINILKCKIENIKLLNDKQNNAFFTSTDPSIDNLKAAIREIKNQNENNVLKKKLEEAKNDNLKVTNTIHHLEKFINNFSDYFKSDMENLYDEHSD